MTKDFQTNVFNFLLKNGIENYVGVPDSTLKFFIDEGIKTKKVIIKTRFSDFCMIELNRNNEYKKALFRNINRAENHSR